MSRTFAFIYLFGSLYHHTLERPTTKELFPIDTNTLLEVWFIVE